MRPRLLRAGELVGLVGMLGLFVVLFLEWFGADDGGAHVTRSGWSSLGWFMVALLCVLMFGALSVAVFTMRGMTPAWPIGAGVLTWVFGTVIVLILLVRVVLAQPSFGQGLPTAAVGVLVPGYLGLLFAALIPLGSFLSIKDERTGARESAYVPPPARPVPGS